jgi:hypothetical protein
MYEVNGRQYLAVSASSTLNPGGGHVSPDKVAAPPSINRAYVVYALPSLPHLK